MTISQLISTTKQVIDAAAIMIFISRSTIFQVPNFTVNANAGGRANWCWAAVAQGVSRHYQPSENMLQCEIAEGILQRNDCCTSTTRCDAPALLSSALRETGNFDGHFGNWIEFADIVWEIRYGHPVGCREKGNDGHYVAISATLQNGATKKLTVLDPLYLFEQWDYKAFTRIWTNTYYTKR